LVVAPCHSSCSRLSSLARRRLCIIMIRSLVVEVCDPSVPSPDDDRSSSLGCVVACHSSCSRSSLIARCCTLFPRCEGLRSVIASRRRRTIVGRHSSCSRSSSLARCHRSSKRGRRFLLPGRVVRQLLVVASAFSSSVCLLWTIAIVRCFSSPVGDRLSPLVARLSLVRRRSRVVMIRLLVGEDCDPPLCAVAGSQSFFATRRALVARSSSLAPCHRLFARWRRLRSFIACPRWIPIVCRHSSCASHSFVVVCALSSSVHSLAKIVFFRCVPSLGEERSSLRMRSCSRESSLVVAACASSLARCHPSFDR